MRFACLLVTDAPLVALRRLSPELCELPLAVSSSSGAQTKLLCISESASALGLYPGLSARQARALCPDLILREVSPDADRALREALLDLAFASSPCAALTEVGATEAAAQLDATGMGRLFRTEEIFATSILTRAQRLELPLAIGIASSRILALLAARFCSAGFAGAAQDPCEAMHIVRANTETAFLAPLPMSLLQPSTTLEKKLARFGIENVQDFLRLPRRTLLSRFGKESLALANLARGEDHAHALPTQKQSAIAEHIELEFSIAALEPLRFTLQGLFSRALLRLSLRGLTCDALELEVKLEDGSSDRRELRISAPTLDPGPFLQAATTSFEEAPPRTSIEAMTVRIEGTLPARDQLDFFRMAGPPPAELHRLIAELERHCGPERIGMAVVADSHGPDPFRVEPFPVTSLTHTREASAYSTSRRESSSSSALDTSTTAAQLLTDRPARTNPCFDTAALALRMLRPPVPAEVRLRGASPSWVRSTIATGSLRFVAGPWRTAGGWWLQSERFAFEHFDVQVSDGTVARLRHDRLRDRWQFDAIYD